MDESLRGEGDRFLVEELHRGSAEAFRRLVDRFGGRLKAFAARRLRGSGIDPEDAVQETFLSLVRNLESLAGIRSLQAFLFTILRRRIADLARKRDPALGALPLRSASTSSIGGVDPASPEATPSTYARRDEAIEVRRQVLADVLEAYLGRLKEERRFRDLELIELIFREGKTHREAAALVGTSEPTVSRVRKDADRTLRDLVARHERSEALLDLPSGDDVSHLLLEIWRENLFTCVKRSTLGSYALGVLDDEWKDYVRFHIEEIACEVCAAHLEDVTSPRGGISPRARERIFTSSVGFLR